MGHSLVRSDENGLFIKTGGHKFRPGAITGYCHAYRMDDGNLKAGNKVKARHIGGTPLAKLTLEDGTVTRWSEEYSWGKDRIEAPEDAQWLPNGSRDFSKQ